MTETFAWPGFDGHDPGHRALHGFLVLDLQYAPERTAELLAELRRFRAGACTDVGGSGNGYEYDCLAEGLRLAPLHDEAAAVVVDYPTVERALEAWEGYCRGLS